MKTAYVFPGQGAQYVGMGRALRDAFPVAREAMEEADDALRLSLSRLFLEGPEDELRLTYYTQPAILTVSIACLRVLRSLVIGLEPAVVAGHSLGEYSALVAAGALSFSDALRLVHLRGRLMDAAVPAGQGSMAAVLGADQAALERLCQEVSQEGGPVEVANVNCPGQLVISGAAEAVAIVSRRIGESGARRAIPLGVSGPFHSSLMLSAGDRLAETLARVDVRDANPPVVANVHARPVDRAADIRKALAQQVARPVLWEASVNTMADLGVNAFLELGPGSVLSGLIRKTIKNARVLHAEDPVTMAAVVDQLTDGERFA